MRASFAITSLPEDVAPAADEMLRGADKALSAARRAGENRVGMFEGLGSRGA